jgi:hypothetical protein
VAGCYKASKEVNQLETDRKSNGIVVGFLLKRRKFTKKLWCFLISEKSWETRGTGRKKFHFSAEAKEVCWSTVAGQPQDESPWVQKSSPLKEG